MDPTYDYPQPLAASSQPIDWNTTVGPVYYSPPLPVPAQSLDWNSIVQHLVQTDPRAAEVFVKISAMLVGGTIGHHVTKGPVGALVGGLIGLGIAWSAYQS